MFNWGIPRSEPFVCDDGILGEGGGGGSKITTWETWINNTSSHQAMLANSTATKTHVDFYSIYK